jgi:hypothetical protein
MKILILLVLGLGPESTEKGVKFTYYDPAANEVYLAGEFNNWSTTATPMKRDPDGVWWIILPLPPGRYEYKFVVDGQWMADPMNPITVGPYGNSVIRVGENYEILPIEPTSNTPMSSIVYFHGEVKALIPFDKEGKNYRLIDSEEDVKLDIEANLGEKVKLWTRFRYNTLKDRDQYQVIPIRIERAEITMQGMSFSFKGFYNRWVYTSDDPFILVGKEGEYHEPFGRDEQGVYLKWKPMYLPEIFLLYSNEIPTDRDLIFGRFKYKLGPFNFGVNHRIMDGLNPSYSVLSPDSLFVTVPTDTSIDTLYLHFNTYEREKFSSLDLSLNFKGKMTLFFAYGFGRLNLRAGEYDVDGTLSRWEFTNLKWKIAGRKRLKLGINFETGPIGGIFSFEEEKLDYDKLFVVKRAGRVNFKRFDFLLSLKREKLKAGVEVSLTLMDVDSAFPWERLWDYSLYDRLSYFEFPLVGYDRKITLEPYIQISLFRKPRLKYRIEGKLARYGLLTPPTSLELISQFEMNYKRWGLLLDHRTYRIKSSFFEMDETFMSTYAEIYYRFSPMALIRLSFGLRPLDFNDELRGRREYLRELGLDQSILVSNFRRLGRLMEETETSLSNYRRIILWGEIKF